MKSKRAPLVSVVTPMYNAEKYIELAVRSVLAQTFDDFEYLIVNDGSTDRSLEIVERLAQEDSRIRVISSGKNQGYAKATNWGFREASGRYIAVMDADDACLAERLAKEVAYLEAHPAVGVVGSQYVRINPEGKILRRTRSAHADVTMPFKLFFSVPMCNPTQMFRREILDDLAPDYYNPLLVGAPEYDFFLRVGKKWKLHVLPDYLFMYRVHPASFSTVKRDALMKETMALTWAEIRGRLPELEPHRMAIETFVRCHRDARAPMSRQDLDLFLEGLDRLCRAYMAKGLSAAEKREMRAFVCELEIKTLLGRHRLYKKPSLLWRWVSNSSHGHIKWIPFLSVC